MDFKKASEIRYNIEPAPEFSEPMIYTNDHCPECKVIASGHYNSLNYYVKNIGHLHPTAYIEIPKGHKAYCSKKLNELPCHYGVTFNESYLHGVDDNGSRGHQFVGWDYGHAFDYSPFYEKGSYLEKNCKRWTTEEVISECKRIINYINEL